MKKIIALVLIIAIVFSMVACGNKNKIVNTEGEWIPATVVGYRCIDKYSAECEVFCTMESSPEKWAYFSTGAPEIGASVEVFITSTGEILDVR